MPSKTVDVAFLVALVDEFRVLQEQASDWMPTDNKGYGGEDYLFKVGDYECVACLVDDKGPGHAGDAAHRLMNTWNPEVIINVGIAASLHPTDLRIGDVFVVNSACDYTANSKAIEGEQGTEFVRGGEYYSVQPEIIAAVRLFEFSERKAYVEWRDSCARRLVEEVPAAERDLLIAARKVRGEPSIERCDLASGPVVGASSGFSKWITSSNRNIKGLEMEAVGVLRAVASRPKNSRVLVLRGISDLADHDKSNLDSIGEGVFRRLAMKNALELIWALMRTERLPRRGTKPPETPPGSVLSKPPVNTLEQLKASVHDPHISVTQLARLCLAYTRSVKDRKFSAWLKKELDGYEDLKDIPDYRKVPVESRANLFDGVTHAKNIAIPMSIFEEQVRTSKKLDWSARVRNSWCELVRILNFYAIPFGLEVLEDHIDKGDTIRTPWPDDTAQLTGLLIFNGTQVLKVWRCVPVASLKVPLSLVRNRIFDYVYPEQ